MGDLSKGVGFADGQSVSAADLNNLVDQAVINAGAVTSPKIAPGAIQTSHINASFALPCGNVALGNNTILGGNAGNVGTQLSLGAGLAISGGALALSGVSGAVLADLSVPDTALAYTGVNAGAFGGATQSARLVLNAQGRAVGASSTPIAGLARKSPTYPLLADLPAPGGSIVAFHGCLSGHNYEASAAASISGGVVTSLSVASPGLPLWSSVPAVAFGGGGGIPAVSAVAAAPGSGYSIGDTLTVAGGTGQASTWRVASLSGSGVATVTLLTAGAYQSTPANAAHTTASSLGVNCTLNVTYGAFALAVPATATATLAVAAVAIQTIGSGYAVNDTLTVSGDTGSQALFTVTAVDAAGGVTAVAITTAGSFTAIAWAAGRAATTNHTGTGCTLTPYYAIEALHITSGGSGYSSAPAVGINQTAAMPDFCRVTLQCQTADLWFSPGDEIPIECVMGVVGSVVVTGLAASINSTAVTVERISTGSYAYSLQVLNNAVNNISALNVANWKIAVRSLVFL